MLKEKAPAPKKGSSKRPLSDATNGARFPTEAESQDDGNRFAGVTPQQLQLKAAPASDKLVGRNGRRVGTGFGNVVEPLKPFCLAETKMLDRLWVWSSNHGRMCGAPLSRVNSDAACWGCHTVGEVNAFRLECDECDAAFNWSSAAPLPGAPIPSSARTSAPPDAAANKPAPTVPTTTAESASADVPPRSGADERCALPDAAELRLTFRAALDHQRKVRQEYSLTAVAVEISKISPVKLPVLSKFLSGVTV
jgi:hypothetical protein